MTVATTMLPPPPATEVDTDVRALLRGRVSPDYDVPHEAFDIDRFAVGLESAAPPPPMSAEDDARFDRMIASRADGCEP